MVLWEITVATAYFLGLKRTYRLASKIQRKIASPKHPKITQFIRSGLLWALKLLIYGTHRFSSLSLLLLVVYGLFLFMVLQIQTTLMAITNTIMRLLLHRRTRAVFDVALQVHHNIQQRDIVGRNVLDLFLQWLDSMKPSANIRSTSLTASENARSNMKMTKWDSVSSHLNSSGSMQASGLQESKRHLFTSSKNVWAMSLPTITLMRPFRPAGSVIQYRHLSFWYPGMLRPDYGYGGLSGSDGVIRKDIMQYLLQN